MNFERLDVNLDDIIGDTTHLVIEERLVTIRGLNVKCWKYTSSKLPIYKNCVIGIHGGPSMCHGYILALKLLANDGYPVILYDQCGCGESTFISNPEVEAPWLLTIEYYIEELKQIIEAYDLSEYYLYGSSWGTVICQEFGVLRPSGLLGMILDGALCDSQFYIKTQWRDKISTLPTYSREVLTKLTEEKKFDTPLYKKFETRLLTMFTTRQVILPIEYIEGFKKANLNIYSKMQGESEFTISGVLESWTITDRLHLVNVPTVVLVGEYDSMSIELSQLIVDSIKTSWPLIVIPRAGHCKLVDEPLVCIKHMVKFLDTLELIRSRKI